MRKIVEFKNINKCFGEVYANKNVNLDLEEGEILALLGENGSGKTTLMNMLSGIYMPDTGEIYIKGEKANINSPEDSKRLGIGMVHQHFKLVENFTAADNILIGEETRKLNLKEEWHKLTCRRRQRFEKKNWFYFKRFFMRLGLILKWIFTPIISQWLTNRRYKKIDKKIKEFGFELDPKKKVSQMSVSEKQTLEIVKALYFGADIIVLDEPTAVLTVQEITKFFAVLKKMKAKGHSIIIITHKLNEIKEISDRVAIMRKGEYIDTVKTEETTIQELTNKMVGDVVELKIDREVVEQTKPLLEIRELKVLKDDHSVAIDDISFYIRGGEILGVAGISGCGQKELCEAIAGLRKVESGKICHKGESILGLSPKAIIQKGISMSFIPEDRLGMGLAPSLDISDNVILKDYKKNFWDPFIDRKTANARATDIVEKLKVVTPSIKTPVRRLSGGNVQKVLVGREIQSGPNVIVTAYPVRGLDINSSYAIYNILNDEKKKGTGILFVGEDLDVLLALCDKIMVICKGKMMGVVHADRITKEEVGLMMTGALDLTKVKEKKNYGIAEDSNI